MVNACTGYGKTTAGQKPDCQEFYTPIKRQFPTGKAAEAQIREAVAVSQFKAIDENGNTVESAELYMTDNPDAQIVFVYQGE
ncbi:MAG: hypothetical protein ACI4K6_02655 [Candidatus Fimenecus sp.]